MTSWLQMGGWTLACTVLAACSSGNDPINGRVNVDMGGHDIVITQCHMPAAPEVKAGADGKSWRTSACNQNIVLQGDTLFVDGEAYGPLGKGDSVHVENGHATIHPH